MSVMWTPERTRISAERFDKMIAAGVLDDPRVDAITMLHVDPRLPTGKIGITPGPVNAAADELHLTIRGSGGHGGYPHLAVDAIPAAAATVLDAP